MLCRNGARRCTPLSPATACVPAAAGHHPGDDVMQALAEAVKSKLWEFTAQVGWRHCMAMA